MVIVLLKPSCKGRQVNQKAVHTSIKYHNRLRSTILKIDHSRSYLTVFSKPHFQYWLEHARCLPRHSPCHPVGNSNIYSRNNQQKTRSVLAVVEPIPNTT